MQTAQTALILVFAIFLSALSPSPAEALPGDNCKAEQILFGNWAINRFFTMADGCLVQVTPINKPNLTYREYVFDESGRFMVFNSLPGPYETATSQRNYFLLPVRDVPRIERVKKAVIVTLANGSRIAFTERRATIAGVSRDLIIRESPEISLQPWAGVEILGFAGVLLDTGWRIGGRAYADRKATSSFVSAGTGECTLTNEQIFAYEDPVTREAYYQPIFKFANPVDLDLMLRECKAARMGIPRP